MIIRIAYQSVSKKNNFARDTQDGMQYFNMLYHFGCINAEITLKLGHRHLGGRTVAAVERSPETPPTERSRRMGTKYKSPAQAGDLGGG